MKEKGGKCFWWCLLPLEDNDFTSARGNKAVERYFLKLIEMKDSRHPQGISYNYRAGVIYKTIFCNGGWFTESIALI